MRVSSLLLVVFCFFSRWFLMDRILYRMALAMVNYTDTKFAWKRWWWHQNIYVFENKSSLWSRVCGYYKIYVICTHDREVSERAKEWERIVAWLSGKIVHRISSIFIILFSHTERVQIKTIFNQKKKKKWQSSMQFSRISKMNKMSVDI